MESIQLLDMHAQKPPVPTTSGQFIAAGIVNTGFGAVVGYFAARIFTAINPIAGAAYGAAAGLSSLIVAPILDKLFGDTQVEKTAKFILNIVATVGFGILGASLAGFSLSVKAAVILSISILALQLITALFVGALCVGCLAGTGMLDGRKS